MKKKIPELQKLATEMVGDGQSPNLFFVSREGVIITIARSFDLAYREWREHAVDNVESALEDRKNGCVCTKEPESDEPGAKLIVIDNSDFILKGRIYVR